MRAMARTPAIAWYTDVILHLLLNFSSILLNYISITYIKILVAHGEGGNSPHDPRRGAAGRDRRSGGDRRLPLRGPLQAAEAPQGPVPDRGWEGGGDKGVRRSPGDRPGRLRGLPHLPPGPLPGKGPQGLGDRQVRPHPEHLREARV